MDEFEKYCRLCLSETEKLISIFENSINIPLELSTCLSIDITPEDLLPKNICNKCANLLHEYYTFYINSKCCEQWLSNRLLEETSSKKDSLTSPEIPNIENLQSPCETEFLAEFLDSSNNSFDVGLLTNDSSPFTGLEYLEEELPFQTTNKNTNSGITFKKITNIASKDEPPDDSYEIHMEIDVLDSDLDMVNELLLKKNKLNSVKTIKLDPPQKTINDNYSCLSCESVFNDFEKLVQHMGRCKALKLTQHKSTHNMSQLHTCKQCNKTFNAYERLHQHVEKCHSDFVSEMGCVYRCRECGELYQSKDKLYMHAKTHVKLKMQSNMVKFVCEECGTGFSNNLSLVNHRTAKHGKDFSKDGPCVYKCKVCSQVYLDRNQLYNHIKKHTIVREKTQHLCDSCGKSFNSYNALSNHVLTHVGKQFQCNICSRQFINGSLLKKHLGSHEISTQICEICGLTFFNEILLNMHQSEHIDPFRIT